MGMAVYKQIASKLDAIKTLKKHGTNNGWIEKHTLDISDLTAMNLPSGSGFNVGTYFNWEKSTPEKLVFDSEFEYMHECGMYDGCIPFTVTVTSSLFMDVDIKVTGKFSKLPAYMEGLKEYITEIFQYNLKKDVPRI